ncbi:DUF7007 domain-containing protein [Bartonella choladocola]|uniref:DUF7007 domain-containing protein n=1 Tax=Bartonella choladocola TaxID=2750995 RepID=A0A1U9MJF5_9HYPH|nr:hypothetical protein [Bartonella choladocola]AQT47986.1 hypothetical protein BBC0122_018910 [Bartonella choladocola]
MSPNTQTVDDEITKGRSSDGHNLYRLGSDTYLIDESNPEQTIIYYKWFCTTDFKDLHRTQFSNRSYEFNSEQDLTLALEKRGHHLKQVRGLNRKMCFQSFGSTPWGAVQNATSYGNADIVRLDTASHGGFKISPSLNKQIPAQVRNNNGFYEEDCEWAIVATVFPQWFTDYENQLAESKIRDSYPDYWETLHNRKLQPGESYERDKSAFNDQHAGNYVVISAISSSYVENMVEVIATLGGVREHDTPEKRFLVPTNEYRNRGEFGFIIDLNKHDEYNGKSDYVRYHTY